MSQKRIQTAQKWVMLSAGLALMGMGVALSARSNLGTSPISSFPYVVSLACPLSLGMVTLLFNALLVVLQKFILKEQFRKVQYLQILVTVPFGVFIDLGMWLAEPLQTSVYAGQLLLLAGGIILLSAGVALQVTANLIFLPGEGTIQALAQRFHGDFGKLKIAFDVALTLLALVASLILFWAFQGMREGTLIAAVVVGILVRFFMKRLKRWCWVAEWSE